MDVMATAKAIGLVAPDGADVYGTIEETAVLAALDELATEVPGSAHLITDAKARVLLSRSAGVEQVTTDSIFAKSNVARDVQLRYRSEMGGVFTDLAIDIAMSKPVHAGQARVGAEV